MKSYEKFAIAFIFGLALTVTGCALLDGLILDPKVNPITKERQYIDVAATEMLTKEQRADGLVVLVDESDRIAGREYEPAFEDDATEVVKMAGQLGNTFGGWGVLAAPVAGAVTGIYMAIRGRRKLVAANAVKGGALIAVNLFSDVLRDYQAGKIDENADGSINMDEIGKYLKAKGIDKLKTPELYSDLLTLIDVSFQPKNSIKAAEAVASQLQPK